jgi:superfamily II DNA/RNA helicase
VQITSPAFGLSARTQAALKARGIEKLFPIQASVLKPAMEGRDVIGRARTGTGKTLAFSLPVIEKLLVRAPCVSGSHPSPSGFSSLQALALHLVLRRLVL